MRPLARLLAMRSSPEITGTSVPSSRTVRRRAYASSNLTPSIRVRMSIRRGPAPIWNTVPSEAKSVADRSLSGAPKRSRARRRFAAFSGFAQTKKSMSLVARGRPVHGECVGADNEELNALVGQALQHLFVVFVQHLCPQRKTIPPALAPRPPRAAPQACRACTRRRRLRSGIRKTRTL